MKNLSPCLLHCPFPNLAGCQEEEFNNHFPTPAAWYCCEVSTGSLAAALRWLQCCICSSAESQLLTHRFSSYLSFAGAEADLFPSPCPHSYVSFQFLFWNDQGKKFEESLGSRVILALRLTAQQIYSNGKGRYR